MARESAIVFAAALIAAAACSGTVERAMAEDSAPVFPTRSVQPQIKAANPKYRSTQVGDVLTRWLTESIAFEAVPNGGLNLSANEVYDPSSGDAPRKPNAHQAKFSIDDVAKMQARAFAAFKARQEKPASG